MWAGRARACPERVNDSEPGPSRETVHNSGSAMLTESSAVGDDGSNAAGQSLNSGEKLDLMQCLLMLWEGI